MWRDWNSKDLIKVQAPDDTSAECPIYQKPGWSELVFVTHFKGKISVASSGAARKQILRGHYTGTGINISW